MRLSQGKMWDGCYENSSASGHAMPKEGPEQEARHPDPVAPLLLGERAREAGQVRDLVARFERDVLQSGFPGFVVLAAENLEHAVGIPVALRTGPAHLGVAAMAFAIV